MEAVYHLQSPQVYEVQCQVIIITYSPQDTSPPSIQECIYVCVCVTRPPVMLHLPIFCEGVQTN